MKTVTNAPEECEAERIDKTITRVSSDLIEERLRANLEPPNAQNSTLTLLLMIQDNLAKTTATAGPRTHRLQAEPCSVEKPELLEPCQEQQLEVRGTHSTMNQFISF